MPGKNQRSVTIHKRLYDEVKTEVSTNPGKYLYKSLTSLIEDAIRHRLEEIRRLKPKE